MLFYCLCNGDVITGIINNNNNNNNNRMHKNLLGVGALPLTPLVGAYSALPGPLAGGRRLAAHPQKPHLRCRPSWPFEPLFAIAPLRHCSSAASAVRRLPSAVRTATPAFDVRSSGFLCSRPGGLELVARLLARSVTFLWHFFAGT